MKRLFVRLSSASASYVFAAVISGIVSYYLCTFILKPGPLMPAPSSPGRTHAATLPSEWASPSPPRFAEHMTAEEARQLATRRGYDEGQRNEALTKLRIDEPDFACSVLITLAQDPAETVKFRSWCYQHLGLLWSQVSGDTHVRLEDCIARGLTAPIDSPIWREALLALSENRRVGAQQRTREILNELTTEQRQAMGPLYEEIRAKIKMDFL